MPFTGVSAMDQKGEFVRLALVPGASIRQLCRRFGISPTTGHKWLDRFRLEGADGLAERSRRPFHAPRRTPEALEQAVIDLRQQHPAWGGRKIMAVLRSRGLAEVPSASTITAILHRHGLPVGAFGGGAPPFKRFEHPHPNDLWQMDFKGHVGLGDGRRLHPLTVLDDHSRFALVLEACADQRTQSVRQALIAAFRRYGLPHTIMTDNGAPWGNGPGQPFTPLGVFLIDQGIALSHARPYHPQTMGKDERFHRSLKAEVLSGPALSDLAAAAQTFERWRHVYNQERPHEALGLAVPASRYCASPRNYRETIEGFDYAPGDILRRVQEGGRIQLFGRNLRVPKAFSRQWIALRPTQKDGVFEVYYRHQFITKLDLAASNHQSQPVHHVSEHPSTISPV